jgi:hypothetical protein
MNRRRVERVNATDLLMLVWFIVAALVLMTS